MYFFDSPYLLFVFLPTLLISSICSWRVKSAFNKYSKVRSMNGYSGAQAARMILDRAGLQDVQVTETGGFLSDHYDPRSKTLALSKENYQGISVANIGIAAHEAGHAIQDARNYGPLKLRSGIVPLASLGSSLGYGIIMVGMVLMYFSSSNIGSILMLAGCALFSLVLVFQLVTLPVEFDATARAKQIVVEAGIVYPEERVGMDKVLNAAAMTYVAAVATTLITLAFFVVRAISGMRD
ncbi:MAG: zinc metallopeptidase [Nitrospinae bacterium]|nr:zinc metallopeptidase [Nitrospinota bacterium]